MRQYMNRSLRGTLLCLTLLLLTALLCACKGGEDEPTPPVEPTPTEIPDEYTEILSDTYPQIQFKLDADENKGLALANTNTDSFPRENGGEKGDKRDHIILTSGGENNQLHIRAESGKSPEPSDNYVLLLECFSTIKDVSVRVDYRTTNGEMKNYDAEITPQKIWQRVVVPLENLEVGADKLSVTVTDTTRDPDIYLRLASVCLIPSDEKMQEIGETLQIIPKYGSGCSVFAVCNVKQFGAIGDGMADDTAAFQAALAYMEGKGGTVYVPEGHFVLTEQLTLPAGVELHGELDTEELQKTGRIRGTVLCCYAGKGDESAAPMFTMNNYSTIQSVAIWYPQQKLKDGNVIPYPYTIAGKTKDVLYGCNLSDIVLVNAYNGIRFGNTYNVLEVIRNVYGTPLSNGYQMGGNADIARVEGISFSPCYWCNSGLPGAPAESVVREALSKDSSAVILERVDWAYLFDIGIDGYKTGLTFRYTSDGINEGSTNGSIYHADIVNCRCGIAVEYAHEIGLMLTNSRIFASGWEDAVAIVLNNKTATAFSVMDCELQSTGKHVIYNAGGTALSVSGTTLTLIGTEGSIVRGVGGDYAFVSAAFSGGKYDVELDAAVYACTALNCRTALRVGGSIDTGTVKQSQDTGAAIETVAPLLTSNEVGLGKTVIGTAKSGNAANGSCRYAPTDGAWVDLTKEPYNVKTGADIGEALEKAFAAMPKGGTVYLPAGTYRLEKAITVPSGVEIRGSMDAPISTITNGTKILTSQVGLDDAEGEALFTLSTGAGLVGIAIQYEKQFAVSGQSASADAPLVYSYTVRGDGEFVYVRNCALVNSYLGIDFATNRCDYHRVESVVGVVYRNFVKVGAGTQGGVVRDVLTNPAYHNIDKSMSVVGNNLVFAELGDCEGEILYADFLYAGKCGLHLADGAENVVAVAFGADSIDRAVVAEGRANATLVNSQIACFTFGQRICVVTEENFTGELSIIGISTWASPTAVLSAAGGKVSIRGGNLNAAGIPAIRQTDGEVCVSALHFAQPSHAIFKIEGGNLRLSGNIYHVLPLYIGDSALGTDTVYENP